MLRSSPPIADRIIVDVWPPGVTAIRQSQLNRRGQTAPTNKKPYQSTELADEMYTYLLQQTTQLLQLDHTFHQLTWHGLICLARISRIIVSHPKKKSSTTTSNLKEDDEEEDEEIEEDVSEAKFDKDTTDIICEVQTQPPIIYEPPGSALSSDISAAPSDDAHLPSIAQCFPHEWTTLQRFVRNAVQAARVSLTLPTASSALVGFGGSVPRACLIAGAAGAGKSTLLESFISTLPTHEFIIRRMDGAHLTSTETALLQQYNTLESQLKSIEPEAGQQPLTGLLILEDVDSIICGSNYPQLSTQLLTLLERLQSATTSSSTSSPAPLILLCCTVKQLTSVPSHFLSAGKFEAVIQFRLLTNEQRRMILMRLLQVVKEEKLVVLDLTDLPRESSTPLPLSSSPAAATRNDSASWVQPIDRLCHVLSGFTPGYVAHDLAKLVQYTLLHAGLRWDEIASQSSSNSSFRLTWADFEIGLKQTHPSNSSTPSTSLQLSNNSANSTTPATTSPSSAPKSSNTSHTWLNIGGYHALKRRLTFTLTHWLHPERASFLGLRPISGVLFHGPSGCGKTLFSRELAAYAGFNFISVSVTTIFSQYLGESEAKIRALFNQASDLAPCLLLFDHLEVLAGKRDHGGLSEGASGVDSRVLTTLLNEMDGVSKKHHGVYVIGCTSSPDALDSALIRPGRFDDVILVDYPNVEDRQEILQVGTRQVNLSKDIDLQEVAALTEGMSGADLTELISRAGMNALRKDPVNCTHVQQEDFLVAVEQLTGQKIPKKGCQHIYTTHYNTLIELPIRLLSQP